MISWVSLALALLKIALSIMTWARERELVSEGQDREIADTTQAILAKTTAGKLILEKVNAMSSSEVDSGLRDLEPK
jgi:hypothetical protein